MERFGFGWTSTLTLVSLGLVGLMAGFFYAYSVSVMVGLREVSDRTFIETMQWINATVRNAWFGPAFFGSLFVTGIAAVSAYATGTRKVAIWLAFAFLFYAIAFLITVSVSVPLNNELRDAGDVAAIADPAAVRSHYEGTWVRWNHVRTVASTASLLAIGGAIFELGRFRGPGSV